MLLLEKNFVIGVIWEERLLLIHLLNLCNQFAVQIVIPEVALVEAKVSLLRRIDRRLNALQQLRKWLNDIARAAGMRKHVQTVRQGLNAIETELQQRKSETQAAIDIFANACTIVPLTPEVWTRAYLRWQANMPPFKELDCLIFKSLLSFLQRRKAPLTMFLTLDVEDFDHPEIHTAFQGRKVLVLFDPRDVIMQFRKFYGVA